MKQASLTTLAVCGLAASTALIGVQGALFHHNAAIFDVPHDFVVFAEYLLAGNYILLTGILLLMLLVFRRIIVERQCYEDQLQASEARFARAVSGGNEGIWEWNIPKNHIYYSPRFLELLGYAEGEIGTTIEDWRALRHPEDVASMRERVYGALEKHALYESEYRIRKKSGAYLWVLSRGRGEWNDKGEAIRMSGSLMDISEKKHIEALTREFTYTVTHELRTPLTALKSAVDMLHHVLGGNPPDQVQALIAVIMRGSDRLMLLINDLLDVGKLEAGEMRFDCRRETVRPLLEEAVRQNAAYGDKFQVRFTLDCPVDAAITIDPDRFQQVMNNLMSNAAKFSPAGEDVLISARRLNDQLRLSVRDRGKGIPANLKSRLFQKFAQGQSDKGGTGLGLHICKTIVEHMNGTIGCDSRLAPAPDHGAEFFMTFPLVD